MNLKYSEQYNVSQRYPDTNPQRVPDIVIQNHLARNNDQSRLTQSGEGFGGGSSASLSRKTSNSNFGANGMMGMGNGNEDRFSGMVIRRESSENLM
jgi:hypothetical protein